MKKSDIAAILATLPDSPEKEAALAALATRTSADYREGIRKRLAGTLALPEGYAGVAEDIAEVLADYSDAELATAARDGRIAYATNYAYGAVRKAERAKGNRLDGKR